MFANKEELTNYLLISSRQHNNENNVMLFQKNADNTAFFLRNDVQTSSKI